MRFHVSKTCAGVLALFVFLALAVVAPPGIAGTHGARSNEQAPRLTPRRVPDKPEHSRVRPGQNRRVLHLKFVEGTLVRVRGNRFVSLGDDDLSGVQRVMRKHDGVRIERLFNARPEAVLAVEKVRIEARSLREQGDKNLYFRLRLPRKVNAAALMDDLNALDIVEITYAEPLPAPPTITDDLTDEQGYRDVAPGGIDALFANGVPGGTGGNTTIIDIEYSWNQTHEDLPATTLFANQTPADPFASNDHGTAVVGELAAVNNSFGVTGLAHGAGIGLVNAQNVEDGYDLADSIDIAHANLGAGDAILLEQQTGGANGGCNATTQVGCVAVEWVQAWYDAIVSATSDGIIVVEAAGNGSEDLDGAEYGSPFPAGRADSGAIIVGAGGAPGCTAPARGRLGFSTFGSRVNLQGWGECVMTTGYGFHSSSVATDPNQWYRGSFGGTSSASPIVTSAAAILSSVAQQQGDADGLTSTQVRSLLVSTGTPQDTSTDTGNIGPLPNLASALEAYLPVADAGGPYFTSEGTDIVLSGAASSDPQGQPLTYAWDLDNNGSFETSGVSPTFTRVGQDGSFTARLRVTDAGGATDIDTATVNVSNVAPTVSLGSDAPKNEGAPVTITGTISDAGWLEDLTATVDWGDGSPVESITGTLENTQPDATLTFDVAHRFGDNGVHVAQVCGSDDDTATCETINLQTNNVDPSVTVDPSQVTQIDEGDVLEARANFSDPGWLDTYAGTVDWGTPFFPASAAAIVDSDQRPNPDTGTASAFLQYGDNGAFTVTTTVSDDDSGSDSDAFDLTVDNVAPTAVIDTSGTTSVNGQDTFVAHAGEIIPFSADSQDPGSDDLTLSWLWGDGTPDATEVSLVNPPGFDFLPSPSVQPRDETSDQPHTFGDACLYEIEFGSADDDLGSASDTAPVVIVGNGTKYRREGYWQSIYGGVGTQEFTTEELECYLAITGFMSVVFNEETSAATIEEAHDGVFLAGNGGSAAEKLDRALLTAWLNFANGAIELDAPLDTDKDGIDDSTFAAVMTNAESVRTTAGVTDAELNEQREIVTNIATS